MVDEDISKDIDSIRLEMGIALRGVRTSSNVRQSDIKGVSIPTVLKMENGKKAYRVRVLFSTLKAVKGCIELSKDERVYRVRSYKELSNALVKLRKGQSYYSLAKNEDIDWRRFRDVEACVNVEIEQVLSYLKVLGVDVKITPF